MKTRRAFFTSLLGLTFAPVAIAKATEKRKPTDKELADAYQRFAEAGRVSSGEIGKLNRAIHEASERQRVFHEALLDTWPSLCK